MREPFARVVRRAMSGCSSQCPSGSATVQYTRRMQWHFYPKEKNIILTTKVRKTPTKYENSSPKRKKKKHSSATDIKLIAGVKNIKYGTKKKKRFSVFPVAKLSLSWLQTDDTTDKIRLMVVRRYQESVTRWLIGGVPRNQSYSLRKIKRKKKIYIYMSTIFLAPLHPSLVSRGGKSCWKDEE